MLFRSKEAAEYLGLKVQTLYNWKSARKGPDYVMIGATLRYELGTLDKFIASKRRKFPGLQKHQCRWQERQRRFTQ